MDYNTFKNITLNGKLFSKEEILQIEISEENHYAKVIHFLKEWFSETDEITVQTSGSTGKPKKINIPKQSFVESAKNTCEYLNLNSKTNALLCIPVNYIGGKMMVIRALVTGYNLVIQEPSSNPLKNPTESIDFIAITPMQAYIIIADNSKELEAIDTIIIGGGKLNSLTELFISLFKNNVYSTFGMTETVSHIALKRISGKEKSDEYVVFDAYNISQNENNCLVIDCPTLSQNQIQTNDIIEITAKNKFRWLGRKDNIINSGGIKICPEEIEEKLSSTLVGLKFYVTSIPDEILGEKLVLKYTNDGFITITPKLGFINSKLEKHKTIKELIYVDSFDYTENGKLIRN